MGTVVVGSSEASIPRGVSTDRFAEQMFTRLRDAVGLYSSTSTPPIQPQFQFSAQGELFRRGKRGSFIPDHLSSHDPALLWSAINTNEMSPHTYVANVQRYVHHNVPIDGQFHTADQVDVVVAVGKGIRRGTVRLHLNAGDGFASAVLVEIGGQSAKPELGARTARRDDPIQIPTIPSERSGRGYEAGGVGWREKVADGAVGTASSLLAALIAHALIGA